MFGLIVAFMVVWWVVFFAVLPFGVRRQADVQIGTDPGAPANPMLWRKAAVTTLIALVVVGGVYTADAYGLIDLRELVFGRAADCVNCGSDL
jgi:predicted secreted protein